MEPYAVSGLPDGATYYFVVTAVDNGLEGLESVEAAAQPLLDCNFNGVEDSVDIQFGISEDNNDNGIPDDVRSLRLPPQPRRRPLEAPRPLPALP